jgi:hydroxyacylglutathione hydrolase
MVIIDVRKPNEFAEGHITGAVNIPLSDMTDPDSLAQIQEDDNLYIHCSAGYRSVIASSLLKRQGIHNLRNVLYGWNRIKELEKIEIVKEKSILN